MSASIRKIFKNQYVFSLASKFILTFLGLINSIIINRYLGPTLKGEYAFVLNLVNILAVLLNLGIYQSYPFFRRNKTERVREKFVDNFVFQFVLYFFLGIVLSLLVRNLNLTVVFTLIPFMILARQLSFVCLVEKINLRNFIKILDSAIYTAVLIAVCFSTEANYVYILLTLYFKSIASIFLFVLVFKLNPNPFRMDKEMLYKSVRNGVWLMLTLLLINLNYKADIIILKIFVDSYYIGLYSIGILLAEQAWLIGDAFKEVLFSKTSKKDSVNEIVFAIKINTLINVILIAGVFVFGKQIIRLLYGVEFVGAYLVTVIIFAGITGMVVFKLIYPYYVSKGLQIKTVKYLAVVSSTNIIFNFLLIPKYGVVGAAVSSVVSYNICGLLFFMNFVKVAKISYKKFFSIG